MLLALTPVLILVAQESCKHTLFQLLLAKLSIVAMEPSKQAISQYSKTSDKLALRVAILSYDTQKQTWYSWLEERLDVAGDVLEVGYVYLLDFALAP